MDWGELIMEVVWASIITGILGIVAVLITNAFIDHRGYKKLDSKIGELNNETLCKQHENIGQAIITKAQDMKELQTTEFSKIYSKVDNIDREIYANRESYRNLNVDQRTMKDNLEKLVYEWQALAIENKELKSKIQELENQNTMLLWQNDKMMKGHLGFDGEKSKGTEKGHQEEMGLKDNPEDEWELEV